MKLRRTKIVAFNTLVISQGNDFIYHCFSCCHCAK